MPRVIHCILNDLSYEQRAHKIALTLSTRHEVLLVGIATIRKRRPVPKRPYSVRRLFVPVEGGMLFFFLANVRLFLYLLFLRRWDRVVVADLDALLGCYWAARLRGKRVILDSRELYPALPSLYGRPLKRWIWSKVEAWLCPKVRYHFTVSPPIAQYYKERYGINAWLIYNMPFRQRGFAKARLEDKLLFYQGVLHPYRGLEEVILALRMVPGWRLWIAGDGKHRAYLEAMVRQEGLQERVLFLGLLPYEEALGYAREATLGVSGELPVTDNHRYALPNKVFDYLQVGLPILAGEAPLIRRLVENLGAGYVVESWQPKVIAAALREIEKMGEAYQSWVVRAREAARRLNWQSQEECLLALVDMALRDLPLPSQEEVEGCRQCMEIRRIWHGKGGPKD
jgi:glycosyltransferase involved in cell wall biosynthesis